MKDTANHVLLTRFNLPTKGVESLVRAKDGWLTERVDLFERYTVPSVLAQTCSNYSWFVYFDPESPEWLFNRVRPLSEAGVFHLIPRTVVTAADVVRDARDLVETPANFLITTNLDNDDGIAVDFLARIQQRSYEAPITAIYLVDGLIMAPSGSYLRRDPRNAFCSVREPWDSPKTCWIDWHNLLDQHMPSVAITGPPAWLQVVHGGNVSNRVRGRLVKPSVYRSQFGDLLGDLREPRSSELAFDRFIASPVRSVREMLRGGLKSIILRVGGKSGLDRLKAASAPVKGLLTRRTR